MSLDFEEIIRKIAELEQRIDDLVEPEVASDAIGGIGANTQVAYWTGTKTIAGDAGFTYNAANNDVTILNDVNVSRRVVSGTDIGLDTYINFGVGADQMGIVAGGITMATIVEAATDYWNFNQGLVFLNETANVNMTQGVTIDQGANDNEIINLRSSDVGAVYNIVETNTFGTMQKVQGTAGGLRIDGFRDADDANDGALLLRGYLAESPSTIKTVNAKAIVEIRGYETDGTTPQDTVADGNVFVVRTLRGGAHVALMVIDEDADMNLPSGRIATGYGDYWDLEDYHAGAPVADGYVLVDINGATYHLLAYAP